MSDLTKRLREVADLVSPPFTRKETEAMGRDWNYQTVEIAFPAAESLATDLLSAALILERRKC